VGGLLALALARQGFYVTILDKKDIHHRPSDHRQLAFSLDVLQWIEALGITVDRSPVTQICLSFDQRTEPIVLTAQDGGASAIGAVIPHEALVREMTSRIKSSPLITLHSPSFVQQWHWKEECWQLTLSTGLSLKTSLVIGCDGAHSDVRHFFSPLHSTFSFPQRICLFTFSPLAPEIAYEHFFPKGSLALLPLPQGRGAGIWMGSLEQFQTLHIESCVQEYLRHQGYETPIYVHSRDDSFTPRVQLIEKCIFPRCVLVGDAAQVVHPIAGQGVNLGLRMARALSPHLTHRKGLGLDWGTGLESYQRQWRKASLALQGATTSIVAGYSFVSAPLLWDMTLGCIHLFPSIRQKLARYATWGGDFL
jgi:2-octaprenyl-3-methyl-6-methoxy-1,4-benzoquinol hydroxylase